MNVERAPEEREDHVAVVGLGYIGLPLAASLAAAGRRVVGVDTSPAVRSAILAGTPSFFEPGLPELLGSLPEGSLTVSDRLPDRPPLAVIICVGTAVEEDSRRPDLGHLRSAVEHVAEHVDDETLVIIRSTVPVGTGRRIVLPALRRRVSSPLLASCPERTIQGRALDEIRSLPQIIGGLDDRSVRRARDLLAAVTPDQVVVSSLEAAEMVKLICNAHTDLIYGFGNEVALLAESLGLDAHELIAGANLRYPRPDLSRPGFVGGSCLVKDPYLLMHAGEEAGYRPPMVAAARSLNESLPARAADRVLKALESRGKPLSETKVAVLGIAYKGRPETDDTRGAASGPMSRLLTERVGTLVGHDFVVRAERIAALGYKPMDLDEALDSADAVILLTDHPGYTGPGLAHLLGRTAPRPVVFDMWGLLSEQAERHEGLTYLRLGHG
ncbi:nucleotide sugar dehydrogenase [Sinosporangium album]|nr:nucleotide sugar dehydrogenase [Sinosporangium album]